MNRDPSVDKLLAPPTLPRADTPDMLLLGRDSLYEPWCRPPQQNLLQRPHCLGALPAARAHVAAEGARSLTLCTGLAGAAWEGCPDGPLPDPVLLEACAAGPSAAARLRQERSGSAAGASYPACRV